MAGNTCEECSIPEHSSCPLDPDCDCCLDTMWHMGD